jgi:CheY-like chemotaxis protein
LTDCGHQIAIRNVASEILLIAFLLMDARTTSCKGTGDRPMRRVLYVEDNDDSVYVLKLRFELLESFEILVAENGETGCSLALSEQPDLIIMDLDMPVVDGWEATRRLKSNPATKAIPIIALSAHAISGAREKVAVGCDEFETKPVDFEQLIKKVQLLANRRPNNEDGGTAASR